MNDLAKCFSKDYAFVKKAKVVLMCGFPGSGKSTIARKLGTDLPAPVISSDKIRQEIFNSPHFDNRGDLFVTNLREKYYSILYKRTVHTLEKTKQVIIDATNMDKQRIILTGRLCKHINKKDMLFIVLKTPKNIIQKRLLNDNKKIDENETLYEAWLRTYGYFEKHLKLNRYFWPDTKEGIKIIEAKLW